MTTTITPNLTTFLEDLKSADLVGISFLPRTLGLRLDFTFGPEANDIAIELYKIVHLVLSQPINPDDEGYCFWVGEVEIKTLPNDGSQLLSDLSYHFTNQKKIIDADLSSKFYFRLEGDICIDVVCGRYQIFQGMDG
jgi:hypothetical protein